MGVKFGMEEGPLGPSSMPNFTPHRCNNKGVGPPKLKFLLRFDQTVEYKRPAGAYPLRDFHKLCTVCTSFQDALGVYRRGPNLDEPTGILLRSMASEN